MSTQTDEQTDTQFDEAVNAVVVPLVRALNNIATALDRIARELSAVSYRQ